MQPYKSILIPLECVPQEICESCAFNMIFHYRTETLAVYCSHNKSGAILPINGTWGILSGVEEINFKEILDKVLTKVESNGNLEEEIKKIVTIKQAKNATKH